METNDGDSADMEGEIEEADHVNESNDQKAIATEEDGEVNSDDESEEEGEIKDDDADCDVSSKDPTKRENKTLSGTSTGNSNASNNQQQKQICKFYAKGQCTWGINCRFLHVNAPPVVPLPIKLPNQRGLPYQAGLHPTGLLWGLDKSKLQLHPTGLHPTGPTGAHQTGHFLTGPHQTRTPHRSNDGQQHGPYPYMPPPMPRRLPNLGPPHPLPPPPPHQPPSTQSSSSNNSESAWERGLRHAKEMIKKASQRKEEEVDFDDKRFNVGALDEGTSHSRDSHRSHDSPEPTRYDEPRTMPSRRVSGSRSPPPERVPPPYRDRERERMREREQRERRQTRDDYYDSEYERRRRLAFEAAPWNDDQSSPPPPPRNRPPPNRQPQRSRENAEMYRDPWRRSKSPPPKWSGPNRRMASSTTSKKSHSMSSISATDSGSDLSGSDSFSGSDSLSGSEASFSQASNTSDNAARKIGRKSGLTRKNRPPAIDHGRSASRSVSHSEGERNSAHSPKRGSSNRNRGPPPLNRPNRSSIKEDVNIPSEQRRKDKKLISPPSTVPKRRDSWSDTSSGSSQSESSQFSGSESETGSDGAFSHGEGEIINRNRQPKSSSFQRNKGLVKHSARSPPPPPPSAEGSRKNMRSRSNHSPTSQPSAKKLRSSSSTSKVYLGNRDNFSPEKGSPSCYDKSINSPPSPETSQKKLIKMTFKKKHPSLTQNRNLTARLNGHETDEDDINPNIEGNPLTSTALMAEDANVKKPVSLLDEVRRASPRNKPRSERQSSQSSLSNDGLTSSLPRREDLVKQLKAVEARIAKTKANAQ